MELGIDPKVDYAFKWLFGNEKNTPLLIDLLHAVLNPAPDQQIADVQILNPFTQKMSLDEKLSVLDIKARDRRGRQFNVEMQMLATSGLRQRILYYWARLYTEQLDAGQDYTLLRPAISVCFVDGVVFPDVAAHHLVFGLHDAARGLPMTDQLAIHFLELPKFGLSAEEVSTPLERWLYFLRHAEELDAAALPVSLDYGEIHAAMEVLGMLEKIDIQKEIYEGRIKARRDERMRRIDALAEGRQEGIEQGIEQGNEQGIAKGVPIGRIEVLERLLRREATPRVELETMSLEALETLAAQLERDVMK